MVRAGMRGLGAASDGRKWVRSSSAVAILLFIGWVAFYVVALAVLPTGCASEMGFEPEHDLVDSVLRAWTWLLLVLGGGMIVIEIGAAMARRLDRPARGVLAGVGFILVSGTIVVSWSLEYLVMHEILARDYSLCLV